MHRLGEIVKKELFNKYVTPEVVAIVQDLANKFIEDPSYENRIKLLSNCPLGIELFMRVSTKPDNPVE